MMMFDNKGNVLQVNDKVTLVPMGDRKVIGEIVKFDRDNDDVYVRILESNRSLFRHNSLFRFYPGALLKVEQEPNIDQPKELKNEITNIFNHNFG